MFEIDSHTADVRLRVRAPSLEELFADSLRGLMGVMKPGKAAPSSPSKETTLTLDAPDLTALLVDFLNEVLLLCHTRSQAFEPESITLSTAAITAVLHSRPVDRFEEDVKAVTYHEADVVQSDGSWSTTLVLDV